MNLADNERQPPTFPQEVGRMSQSSAEIPGRYQDLAYIQLHAAERWRERGLATEDVFMRYFCLFAAFNALYYLWNEVDEVKGDDGRPPGEGKQIEHMLRKLSNDQAILTLDQAAPSVRYFSDRPPVQRMGMRDPAHPYKGNEDEGQKWRNRLIDSSAPAADRVVALAQILYLVRSNLVHGGKMESGDDEVVVRNAVGGLEAEVDAAINLTHGRL
jgi:hypothetical protein